MEEIAITTHNESNQNVYIRQIGEDDDVDEGFPWVTVFIGFGIEIMNGQTSGCMSQG